jgi:peptide/nickel transport system ATP-binding protein
VTGKSYEVYIRAGKRELVAIQDFQIIDFSVNVILGESGIGKSLTALALYGLLDPDELEISINGTRYGDYVRSPDVINMRQNGFFVFQEPSSHLNPLSTLQDQLNEGSLAGAEGEGEALRRLWPGVPSRYLSEILSVYPKPYRPSGGEKQRVLAAMAFKKISRLKNRVPGTLFIFDEPTGNLDNRLRDEFLDLLMESFTSKRITVVLITHDYSMISRLTKVYPVIRDRIFFKELCFEKGKLRQRDFVPSEYLDWLASRSRPPSVSQAKEPILKMDSRVSVFGRNLTITRDPFGQKPTDLVLHRGRATYLKAASGVGKTTILKLIMGLVRAERMELSIGEIRLSQDTPRRLWHKQIWGKIATMVFQHADEALNQQSDVKGVFSGLPISKSLRGRSLPEILSDFFDGESMEGFLDKEVKYLSGGQKQRLNLLRSLVLDTDILLLDEPLNGLDFKASRKVIRSIERKLDEGKAVLIVSHNEEIFDTLVASESVFYLQTTR